MKTPTTPREVTVTIGGHCNTEDNFCLEVRREIGGIALYRRLLGFKEDGQRAIVYDLIASIPEHVLAKHIENEWDRLARLGIVCKLERQGRPGTVWLDLPPTPEVIRRFFNLGSIVVAANGKDYYKWDHPDVRTLNKTGELLAPLKFDEVIPEHDPLTSAIFNELELQQRPKGQPEWEFNSNV